METTTRSRSVAPRSAGPFVTVSGQRMPVRYLTQVDVPALVEFSDFRARVEPGTEIVGFDRVALASMVDFEPGAMIGLMVGPRLLVRGVASYRKTSVQGADVRFTVDESVLADGVFLELAHRIADSAREQGITELRTHGRSSDIEREALAATGYPSAQSGDQLVLDITDPR